jgi:Cdc6-like AAA superfamily ATPase
MDKQTIESKLLLLNGIFTPASPIITRDLFFGRVEQLNRVIDTINEKGQHAVLYGERGVGKTSLANIINESLKGILTAKVTCNRTENFTNIWKKMFKRVSFIAKSPGTGFTAVESEKTVQLDLFLPKEEEVDSTDILAIFENLTNPVLFIFDEFDSVKDSKTQVRFADTIKALSDNAPHVTLLIVGIAESINELIGDHPSIERCIKQIKLPRMSSIELSEIIDKGLARLEMQIDPLVRRDMIDFSEGFPHYTHLLTKFTANTALQLGTLEINRNHFDLAIEETLENVRESIRESYQRAVITTRKEAMFDDVLSACALAKEDEHGTFRATDLEKPLYKVTGRHLNLQAYIYHLGKLCQDERGGILQKIGFEKQHRYRFANPLLKAFVRIKLYQSGKLSRENSNNKKLHKSESQDSK